MDDDLLSMKETAAWLGCKTDTVRDLIRHHRIKTHTMRLNGNAKGVDRKGREKLRKLLPILDATTQGGAK